MFVDSILAAFAARPELVVAVFVVLALRVVVLMVLVAVATLVALFGGPERAGQAHRILRDLLDALPARDLLAALLRRGGQR